LDEAGDYALDGKLVSIGAGRAILAPVASHDTSRKVLAHAAAQLGVAALAERLQISERLLHHYLTGHDLIPDELFLRAVDVIIEQLPAPKAPPSAQLAKSPNPESDP
jgi:hypothetical protein